ncbi:class I SAM-dependent methyltransferase [Bradyrhizobium liaoningense]|nr:class I SAM-dependent methyltransferase [Bradyrhizobium liaoningense]
MGDRDDMNEALREIDLELLDRAAGDFCRFFELVPRDPAAAMHGTISQMHALCCALAKLPAPSWNSPNVQRLLAPALRIHARSSFVCRLQEWPRGYPGDFETVELLAAGSSLPTTADPGDWIQWYALNTAIAQQHRNRIWWQYLKMCATTPGRILSLGCGGGPDFQIAPHRFTGSTVVLVDPDKQALALAEERLSRHCDVHIFCGDARQAIRRVQDEGPFDVIVCGYLFEYLDDRTIIAILGELRRRLLRVGGSIVFTNIASGNPFRVWMEAIADWKLIHRSAPDLRRITAAAGFDTLDLSIQRDQTGLTHLVEINVA